MDTLTPSQQLLIAAAWVDGRLDPSEAQLLRQLLGEGRAELEDALQNPLPVADILDRIPPGEARHETMRDVLRTVFADEILEFEEFDLLERVATQLGIDSETLETLRLEVTRP